MSEPPLFFKRISIYSNEKFICFQTRSGYRSLRHDPNCPPFFLPLHADNLSLGKELLRTLLKSRFIEVSEVESFDNLEVTMQDYKSWVNLLIVEGGYKTKRALFKNMENCSVVLKHEEIIITPLRHIKIEAWDSMGGDEKKFVVSMHETFDIIGSTVRDALKTFE